MPDEKDKLKKTLPADHAGDAPKTNHADRATGEVPKEHREAIDRHGHGRDHGKDAKGKPRQVRVARHDDAPALPHEQAHPMPAPRDHDDPDPGAVFVRNCPECDMPVQTADQSGKTPCRVCSKKASLSAPTAKDIKPLTDEQRAGVTPFSDVEAAANKGRG